MKTTSLPKPPPLTRNTSILILGAGPTGLGAATRLASIPNAPAWLVIEGEDHVGGLATTITTPQGFLFDLGGHVIFSHYEYFDTLLQKCVGEFSNPQHWTTHVREAYVRFKNSWVPYPFQNNLTRLPVQDQIVAIDGMIDAKIVEAQSDSLPPHTFDEWILRTMGTGLADLFMRPYNFKVWAVPTTEMSCGWLGERVAVVDVKKAIANALHKRDDVGWGPNSTFHFPTRGGTGSIWNRVTECLLPKDNLMLGSRVVRVDLDDKIVTLANGNTITYDTLISTLPLDVLLGMLTQQQPLPRVINLARSNLIHSSTHVVGFGIRGMNPHANKCWLYFPESNCPFYRATIFSHYGEGNVPHRDVKLPTMRMAAEGQSTTITHCGGGPYWSVMLEISESTMFKAVDSSTIVEECLAGCIAVQLLLPQDEIVSIFHRRVEYGYPTPSLNRDVSLQAALPYLRGKGCLSRGRFGSWRYEVSNQDHSLALGVECVDNLLFGTEETTLYRASYVNRSGQKNTTPQYGVLPSSVIVPCVIEPTTPGTFVVEGTEFPTKVASLVGMSFANVKEYVGYCKLLTT